MNHKLGCVVVQGEINPIYLPQIRKGWEGFVIIFSTWEGVDTKHFIPDDIVLLNDYPEDRGVSNLGCQKLSTQRGMELAKELGWKRAIKWRSDQWPINGKELVKNFTPNGMNIYSWINDNGGYICDYFMEGEVDSIIELFDVPINGEFPERHLTRSFFGKGLNVGAKTIVKSVRGQSDIVSGKWDLNLSSYVDNPVYGDEIPNEWDL